MGYKHVLYALCVLSLLLSSIAGATVALADCPQGTNDVWKFTGGGEGVTGIRGVGAYIGSYNPTPVYQQSCIWTMLTKQMTNPDRYAQVGYYRVSQNSNIYVFCQFTDDSGIWYAYYYNSATNYWTGVPSTTPTGSPWYEVTYSPGSPGTFYVKYGTGAAFSVSYQWVPSRLEVYGETHNYGTPNKGDRYVGDLPPFYVPVLMRGQCPCWASSKEGDAEGIAVAPQNNFANSFGVRLPRLL